MLINLSSTHNESAHQPEHPMNHSLSLYMMCLTSSPISTIFILFVIIYICLHLPLSVFILHHGLQHWKKHSNSLSAAISPSDYFAYHLASMELIGIVGYLLTCCAICTKNLTEMLRIGTLLYSFTWFGEMCFHMLTCVEHYLAVVHPIIYVNMKNRRWIRIRNMIVGFIWLLCLLGVIMVNLTSFLVSNYSLVVLSVVVVSVCNFSVLRILMRPRPGEQGRGRERADLSKQKAFYTILVILGTLVLRFSWGLIWNLVYISQGKTDCFTMTIDVWFNLPSSVVLPLLFLHRMGRFLVCKKNTPSG